MALREVDANPPNNLPPGRNHRRVQHKYLIFISEELVFGSDNRALFREACDMVPGERGRTGETPRQ